MKTNKFCVIFLLFFTSSLMGQSSYDALIDTSKQWNVLENVWDYDAGSYQNNFLFYQRTLGERFRGAEMIDGVEYHYLEQCTGDSLFLNWNRASVLYREDLDERKVYAYTGEKEYLIYDFSMEKGDTLKLRDGLIVYVVDSIDYPIIANKQRRRTNLRAVDNSCPELPCIVEGVGGFENMIAPFYWGTVGSDKSYRLQCYYEEDDLLYQQFNDCYTYVDYTGVDESQNPYAISVYPNPTSDFLIINTGTLLQEGVVQIISLDGKLRYTSNLIETRNEISVSHLDEGLYILVINRGRNDIYREKIFIIFNP